MLHLSSMPWEDSPSSDVIAIMPASKDLVSTLEDGYEVWFARQHNNLGRPRENGKQVGDEWGRKCSHRNYHEKEKRIDNWEMITEMHKLLIDACKGGNRNETRWKDENAGGIVCKVLCTYYTLIPWLPLSCSHTEHLNHVGKQQH